MPYSGNLITIDSAVIGKLTGYDVGFHKLWAADTGRNMKGENKGTLIGIFPKLILSFGSLTEDEMSVLAAKLNKASVSVTWYDPEIKATRTASFYTGDWQAKVKKKSTMMYEPFEVSIIANQKR